MIVQELIAELQRLPEELKGSFVSCEYRIFRGELDMEGEPATADFYSVRVDETRTDKRVVLY
jgi:hypothetical protein